MKSKQKDEVIKLDKTPELKVRWLDKPPERVYECIAKATLNCHSEDPINDMAKIDSVSPVEMWNKKFANGHELAVWLTKYIRDLNHGAMLEFSGQFNFLVTENSRGLTHEQVRQRIGISYAQRSTRFVKKGDFITPYQLSEEDKTLYVQSIEELAKIRHILEEKYPKDVTRHLLPIATHSPIVIGYNNIRSLYYDLGLRCCMRAHWEIRYMATEIRRLCREQWPDLFDKAGAHCKTFGYCLEGNKQCKEKKGKVPTLDMLLKCWEENKGK
jgi:thymidylate synthase (FAD)